MLGGRLAGVIGHFYDLRLRHATTNYKKKIGNPFFERPFLRRNAQKKESRTEIIYDFIQKLLSETILDLWKCPNQKTHESESTGSLVWALPEVQNWFQRQFVNQVLYNYHLEFLAALSSS